MGEKKLAHEFDWVATSEPHASRRKAILAAHGDKVRRLYGYDRSTAVQVVAVMAITILTAFLVRDAPWWKVLLAAYAIGGTASQNLFCAQHELSHFLAFRTPLYNRILSFASNCPLAIPMATAFRKYHQEHHSHLGVDGWDVDLPTAFESAFASSLPFKLVWCAAYLAIYGLRPLIVRPKKPDAADVACLALVLGFDAAVLYFWGVKSLAYFVAGALLGGGLHPLAGHLIAEHYTFLKGQETYSYYGPLNALTYNVGYHNEHHDFPQIPHTRLWRLREIAPEFYKPLAHHTSWCWVLWTFLTDASVGPWTRMKRADRGGADPAPPGAAARAVNYDLPAPLSKTASYVDRVTGNKDDSAATTPTRVAVAASTPGVVTRASARKAAAARR